MSSVELVEASPQPSAVVALYQLAAALATVYGNPKVKAVPDSRITPDAMGSSVQAYE
jgi:hypothetical protein